MADIIYHPTNHKQGAVFSPCRSYRYALHRFWDIGPRVCFIGLNPSTATESVNDPTVTRCISYAKRWGYGGMYMLNIFAYRATDPKMMLIQQDPIGPENDFYLKEVANKVSFRVACWGNHGEYLGRGMQVKKMIKNLHWLKMNNTGQPAHPLYLSQTLQPISW